MSGGARRTGNALLYFGGELGSRLLAFTATAYLAVTLGPSGFGVVGFALAFSTYLMVLVDTGFADLGSREVARDRENAGGLAASVTTVRLLIAAVLFALVWVSSPLIEEDPQSRTVLVLMCLLLFPAAINTTWVFRGREEGLRVGTSLVIRRLGYAVLVFIWIRGPEDLTLVPVAQVVGDLIGVLWLGMGVLALGVVGFDLAAGWRTYVRAAPLIMGRFLRTSIISLDVLLLGFMTTDAAVGLYSAPYRVCFLVMALASAVQAAYLPDVSRSLGAELATATRRHTEVSLTLGLPITLGGLVLAEPIMSEVFGAEYLPATVAFQLILVSVGLLFFFSPMHNVLLVQDKLRLETWLFGIAAVGNAILNLFWIPRFGIEGAAAATVMAECFILVVSGVIVWPSVGSAMLGAVAKPAVASIVMAVGLLVLSPERALLVGIPAGALLYGISLIALRGVPEDMRASLGEWLGGTRDP